MSTENRKPVIGFTSGDINGIGIELIIKVLSDARLNEVCTPVVFANGKTLNFYKKTIGDINFSYSPVKDKTRLSLKQVNLYNAWEEEINITPGTLDNTIGKYAYLSLKNAVDALKDKWIDGLVTLPIHKKTIQSDTFNYSGHTPYLRDSFHKSDVLMLLVADNMKVAVVTEHVPVKDIADHITKEAIVSKLQILNDSLKKDFGISKPRIAVLGLNPHAGDEGLIGTEEESVIKPAIKQAKQSGILCLGPYSADAFFARGYHERFDAVLAMYHDQGLIPFKSLAKGEGVNYSAGLPIVRTSPDHGTAFDIAGKNKADAASTLASVYKCIDIIKQRYDFADMNKNPIHRRSEKVIGNAEDEKVIDTEE